jgi:hypothetical protein
VGTGQPVPHVAQWPPKHQTTLFEAVSLRCGTEPLLFSAIRAEHALGRCRAIAFVPLFAIALFAIAPFVGSLPGLGVHVNDIDGAAVQG